VIPRTLKLRVILQRMEDSGLHPFAKPPAETEGPAMGAVVPFSELELDRVTFHYEDDHDQPGFETGPFSMHIRAGEVVFIVGGNGAGKTTLAKLLCGLYTPSDGRVLLNGKPVAGKAGLAELHARFAAVFTDDPLFGHVLGVNAEKAESRGAEIIKELKLSPKVSLNGTHFSTIDLSQGQRRRLILLNALLEDRPILLLDEWAADQDPGFRTFFYQFLVPELRARGKTLVLITHDDRYFDRADRVLKIENGRLLSEKDAEEKTSVQA
jgi:putative ATP-binding cassette transporter